MSLLHEVSQSSYKDAINKIAKKIDTPLFRAHKYSGTVTVDNGTRTKVITLICKNRGYPIIFVCSNISTRDSDGTAVFETLEIVYEYNKELDRIYCYLNNIVDGTATIDFSFVVYFIDDDLIEEV